MKKVLAILSVLTLLFSVGCTQKTTAPATTTESASSVPQTTEFVPSTEATTEETTVFSRPETTVSAVQSTATQTETTVPEKTTTQTKPTQTQPETTTAATQRTNVFDKIKEGLENVRIDVPQIKSKDFFNDVVFVGDSVTQGLKNYTNSRRNKGEECLGTAQFLCCGSMSYTNALNPVSKNSLHPTYHGQKVSVEDGIAQSGAGKAFIMLGMNDFSAYNEKTWRQSVQTLIDRIIEKNPRVQIYIESVTPIVSGMEHGAFSNANIDKFNAYLKEFCAQRGLTYVDISTNVMQDDSGHLKKSYCGDPGAMGIHMSNAGSDAWVQYLTAEFCGN
ncbi:MAG: GDSL-type esterase/lipase family protein [Acutalibacteraceae bacterium]